ncbi:MAG: hypothetical protein LBK60_08525 [Verrucomicrobiales bacterium]|jgi:hypothetical protein|nr:hypothetical protein [Verrucomicrobiales bacterium]
MKRWNSWLAAVFMLTVSGWPARAQDLDVIRSPGNIDLSRITDAFTRNMTLLDRHLSSLMHDDDTHELMQVVIGKAGDLSRYYRSGGGASKRRKLLEEMETLKRRPNITRSDQTRIDELNKAIQTTDPDGMFGKARSDFGQSTGELQRYLGLYQTSDTNVTDLIRLIQAHLQYYQTALGKYR